MTNALRIKIPGSKAKPIIEKDTTYISHVYSRYFQELVISEGKGSLIKDIDGNEYIDFIGGIAALHVGHCHPDVVEATKRQVEKLMHASPMVSKYQENVSLAEKLMAIVPGDLKDGTVFFCNSGAEAAESCVKLARYYTRKSVIIAYQGAFHGRTIFATGLSSSKSKPKKRLAPLLSDIVHVPYPYCYRCVFGREHPDCDFQCIKYIDSVFDTIVPPENVAAMIIEPIQGDAGYIVPPEGYFQKLNNVLKKRGILLIDDEVQSGLGRTGKMFAIEHWEVTPHIMALGKGMAGGLPLGAALAKKKIMDAWEPGSHGTTMGGNPVSCVASLTAIQVIQRENLLDRAERLGGYVKKRLKDLAQECPLIGEVRGKGFMIGVELVSNRDTKEPAVEQTNHVIKETLKRGLILIGAGMGRTNVLRIAPALNIPEEQLDKGLEIIEGVLKDTSWK